MKPSVVVKAKVRNLWNDLREAALTAAALAQVESSGTFWLDKDPDGARLERLHDLADQRLRDAAEAVLSLDHRDESSEGREENAR